MKLHWKPFALAVVGLLPLFFVIFAGLFTDGPNLFHPERFVSYGLAIFAYGGLSLAAFKLRARPVEVWVSLGVPLVLFEVWYVSREAGALAAAFLYAGFVAVAILAAQLVWRKFADAA